MNRDIAQGNWQQLSGKIKQKWGKLTDDDLTRAEGDRDYLVGKLHEQYGLSRDRAEDELQRLGYGEETGDVDQRSSQRSSAGRMELSGSEQDRTQSSTGTGSAAVRLDAAGYAEDEDNPNASSGSPSGSGARKQPGAGYQQDQERSARSARGTGSSRGDSEREAAGYQQDQEDTSMSNSQQDAGSSQRSAGSNQEQGGSRVEAAGRSQQAAGRGKSAGSHTPRGAATDKEAQRRGGQHSHGGGRGGSSR